MAMTLLQSVGMVSQYTVIENLELFNRTDGNATATVGRVSLTLYCNREYRLL